MAQVGSLIALGVLIGSFAVVETRGKGCNFDGDFYKHNEDFSSFATSCIKYRCVDGHVHINEYGCGADDTCYPEGSNITVGCTAYKCTNTTVLPGVINFHMRWIIIEDNCYWKGTCYGVDKPFQYNCSKYVCTEIDFTYHVFQTKMMCSWNGSCHDFGQPAEFNCSEYTCTYAKKELQMPLTKLRCSWNGQCYDVGKPVDYNCSQYTCTEVESVLQMPLTKPRCTMHGVCHDVDKSFLHKCSQYTCKTVQSKEQMSVQISAQKLRCSWNKTCYDVGETVNSSCSQYKCTTGVSWEGYEVSEMSPTELRCSRNGTCYNIGETVNSSCSQYTCTYGVSPEGHTVSQMTLRKQETCCVRGSLFQDGDTFSPPGNTECVKFKCSKGDVVPIKEGCEFNNTCIPLGKTVEDGCRNVTCNKIPGISNYEYHLDVVKTDTCCVRGSLFQDGETFSPPGDTECVKFNCSNGVVTTVKEGCHVGDECQPLGYEHYIDGCNHYVCTYTPENTVDFVLKEYCQEGNACQSAGFIYYKNGCDRHVCTKLSNGSMGHLFLAYSGCCFLGVRYDNGQVFTPRGEQRCTKYRCSDGIVKFIEAGCEVNETCYPLGETHFTNCSVLTCSGLGKEHVMHSQSVMKTIGCHVGDTCLPEGYFHYTETCELHVCKRISEYTVALVFQNKSCHVEGACLPEGSVYYKNGCELHICTRTSENTVALVFQNKSCHDGSTCLPEDSLHYKNGCERHICPRTSYKTVPLWTLRDNCQAGNACLPERSVYYAGCKRSVCTRTSKHSVYWRFQSESCLVGNKCLPEGFVHYKNDCERHVCTRTPDDTMAFLFRSKSCSVGDKCFPEGSVLYKNGCHRHVCTRTPNNTVALVLQDIGVCCHLGDRYEHGQVFVISGIRNCFKYRCDHGVVRLIEEGCVLFDNCIVKGDMEEINCTIYACVQTEGNSSDYQIALKRTYTCCIGGSVFKDGKTFTPPGDTECVKYHCSKGNATLTREGCQRINTCIPPGGTFEEGCRTITCTKVPVGPGFEYQLLETRTACEFNDKCIHLGDSVEHKCRRFTCTKIPVGLDLTYQLLVTRTGCELNKKCIPLGVSVELLCSTLTCTEIAEGTEIRYKLVVTETDCQDGNVCIPVGAVHYMNGCERYVCTNTSNGTATFSFQKEDTCCVGGSVFKDGEMFTPTGNSKCVKCSCSKGDVVYIREGCELNDKCISPGATFEHECGTINCTKIAADSRFDYQLFVTRTACELNNACIPLGESVVQRCRTLTCTQIPVGSEFDYQLLETRTDCQFGDTCIPVDSMFYMNVCERYVCRKQLDGTVNYVSMKENTCCVRGTVFDDGQTFTPPGQSDCVKYQCYKGYVLYIKEGCLRLGECYPLGHIYSKSDCEHYVCMRNPDGTANYLLQKENTCCVRGIVFQDGEIFTPPGGTECVKFHCLKGEYTIIKEDCED